MGTEAERQDTKKAMAYDIIRMLEEEPTKETYTVAEIKKLVVDYINLVVSK